MIRYFLISIIFFANTSGCTQQDGGSGVNYWNEGAGSASSIDPAHVVITIPEGFSTIPAGDVGPGETAIRFSRGDGYKSGIEIEIFSKKHTIPKFSDGMEELAWLDSEPWSLLQRHLNSLNVQRRADARIKVHEFRWNRRKLNHPQGTSSQKIICSDAYADIEDVSGKPVLLHTRSLTLYCSILWKRGREIDRDKGLVLIQVSVMDGWVPSRNGRPDPDFETLAMGVMRSVEIVP